MIKKDFLSKYFLRIFFVNFTGILFLYDTTSFNLGLISIQSFIYSINSILLYIFLFIEVLFSFLQYYGLDFEFINLVVLNFKNLDYNFVKIILLDKSIYVFFLITNLILFINLDNIINFFLKKKIYIFTNKFKICIIFLLLFILILFLPFEINKKIRNKIVNFEKTTKEYSFFRNDNWFISIKSEIFYSKNVSEKKSLYIEDFSKIIDTNKFQNIYIIINESYPNFKNEILGNKLFDLIIKDNEKELIIKNYKKTWSKKYSTQGAELNLFCGKNENFYDFTLQYLSEFITKNNCYFENYKSINKVFIHSHTALSFNRKYRYESFFNQVLGFEELENLKLDKCEGAYYAYCDHQLLGKIKNYANKKKNIIIFLTVNNHIPPVLISKTNVVNCKDYHPLNINRAFCDSFHNQVHFNVALSKFISELKKEELIIFYSDTPPIFPKRERIHFKDYIDVYTFEKK